MPQEHEKLDYVEFPATDISATKTFFSDAFHWQFTDYGTDYAAFDFQGLEGGFYRSDTVTKASSGAALLVFYSDNLEATQMKVEHCGGKISKPTFTFPGGKRFHFIEPSGNEFAVWSKLSDE